MAYVYRHIRLDKNVPFYIGVGSTAYYKRAKSKLGRNPIWRNIVSKTDYIVEILFDDISIEEAKKKEIEFVALYGRINMGTGTLSNISGGGDGMFDVPQSVKDKFSIKFAGNGNPFYGKKHSSETKLRMSKSQKGVSHGPHSEATKLKISKRHKGKPTWIKGKKNPKGAASMTGNKHFTHKGDVYCYNLDGKLLNVFPSVIEAAKNYGFADTRAVARVIRGNRPHTKGLVFRIGASTDIPYVKNPRIKDKMTMEVINLETGIFYDSIKDACIAHCMPYRNLGRYLNGSRKNKTSLILL